MRRIFSVLILAALGAMGTEAATEPADSDNPTVLSDSIIVTANRVGLAESESVWPATVLTNENLQNQLSLETALDGKAGLDVRGYNGFGSVATLSNWGTFNRHVLLLYNGRVVKDYSLGGFNLSDFSSSEIERVEILKGPQSAFYGSDAVGGVVNLITRNSLRNNFELSIDRGTDNLQSYGINFSRRQGSLGLSSYAQYAEADNNRDNAGSRRTVLGVRTDYLSHDSRHHLSLGARNFTDSLGVPGPVPDPAAIPIYGSEDSYSLYDHQKDENYSVDLQYRFDNGRTGTAQLDLFWEKKNLDYNYAYGGTLFYYIDTTLYVDSTDVRARSVLNKRSAGISGRYSHRLSSHRLAGGIDFLSGSIRGTTDDRGTGTNLVGPFAPYEYSLDSYNFWYGAQDQLDLWSNAIVKAGQSLSLDLSGRLQLVKNRRTQPSYNLGVIFGPADNWQLKIGYAFAFRLPTISEQFAEEIYTAGSSDLNPETSRTLIGTVAYDPANRRFKASLTGFYQVVDSLIQYQFDPSSFFYVPENVNRFRSAGVDAGLSFKVAPELSLNFSGVLQKARQTLQRGAELVDAYYVPQLKWRLNLTGNWDFLTYGSDICYTSERSIVLGDSPKTLASVYELGATVSASATSDLSLSLAGYDLTDQRRPDQFGFTAADGDYPSPGRRFALTVRYKVF